jgi:hypothetical protein
MSVQVPIIMLLLCFELYFLCRILFSSLFLSLEECIKLLVVFRLQDPKPVEVCNFDAKCGAVW